jgi:hypothetical protein
LLILHAAVALTVPPSPSDWDERRRRECRLCGWLVAGLALFLATPLPTFPHYFILVVPFVSILAALGMNVLGARLWPSARPVYVVLPLVVLFALGLAKLAVQLRGAFYAPRWAMVEELAREVNRVTPRDGLVHEPSPRNAAAASTARISVSNTSSLQRGFGADGLSRSVVLAVRRSGHRRSGQNPLTIAPSVRHDGRPNAFKECRAALTNRRLQETGP